jgi:hypothetical protein
MASYEGITSPPPPYLPTNPSQVEHNIPPQPSSTSTDQPPRPRRPDLSTFFTTLEYTDTSHSQNPNILPIPQNVSATFRTAANAYIFLRESVGEEGGLLTELIEVLMGEAEGPPRVVEGVDDEFLAGEFFCSFIPIPSTPWASHRRGWGASSTDQYYQFTPSLPDYTLTYNLN